MKYFVRTKYMYSFIIYYVDRVLCGHYATYNVRKMRCYDVVYNVNNINKYIRLLNWQMKC